MTMYRPGRLSFSDVCIRGVLYMKRAIQIDVFILVTAASSHIHRIVDND